MGCCHSYDIHPRRYLSLLMIISLHFVGVYFCAWWCLQALGVEVYREGAGWAIPGLCHRRFYRFAGKIDEDGKHTPVCHRCKCNGACGDCEDVARGYPIDP